MERYNVIITPDAAVDLSQLKSYIAYTLQAPETALKYIRGLRQEIEKLDSFPGAVAPVPDEPWQSSYIDRPLVGYVLKEFSGVRCLQDNIGQ